MKKFGVVPVSLENSSLSVALLDPSAFHEVEKEIRMMTGLKVKPFTVKKPVLDAALAMFDLSHDTVEKVEIEKVEEEAFTEAEDADQPPVIKTVNLILLKAGEAGTSDIHINLEKLIGDEYPKNLICVPCDNMKEIGMLNDRSVVVNCKHDRKWYWARNIRNRCEDYKEAMEEDQKWLRQIRIEGKVHMICEDCHDTILLGRKFSVRSPKLWKREGRCFYCRREISNGTSRTPVKISYVYLE